MERTTVFFVVATRGRVSTMLRPLFQMFRGDNWNVVIFSPFSHEVGFRKEFEGSGVYFESIEKMGVWARRVAYVRADAMRQEHPMLEQARSIHHSMTRGFRKGGGAVTLKKYIIRAVAFFIPWFLKRSHTFWEYCMRYALSGSIEMHIKKYKPSIIVLASAGAEGDDVPFIVAGNARGVPTLAVDSNIDAASYRYFSAPWRATHLALFSEVQKKEFSELHDIPLSNMTVVGALRYDSYFRDFKAKPRLEFLKTLGLDSSKKVITLGAKTPIVFPHNEDIIEMVQRGIGGGRFGAAELYVRFDPGHDLSRYSKEFLESFKWERAEDAPDTEHIANLLSHSAVYLGLGASTLAIEACAVGTPSLWIGFDGNVKYRDTDNSCRIQYDLPVFRRIVKTGGIPLVENEEDLLSAVQRYIEHPEQSKNARERMLMQEYANAKDGRAAERIFALAHTLVQ
ncbi:MAG TPA: hypothetical protein VJH33_00825 [Candidatus Paceibacterota bacterium]